MKLYFATQNQHKLDEARAVLSEFDIEVEQLGDKGAEDKNATVQEVARRAARELAQKHNKPVIVDDTGVFFTAYKNFPGAHPKLMFDSLGYEGLLTLLAGKPRDAYFLTAIALCVPGDEPVLFEGRMDGRISMIPYNLDKEVMPYERIFVPKNTVHTLSSLSREKKNSISHRAAALRKLGEFVVKERVL